MVNNFCANHHRTRTRTVPIQYPGRFDSRSIAPAQPAFIFSFLKKETVYFGLDLLSKWIHSDPQTHGHKL